MVKVNIRG